MVAWSVFAIVTLAVGVGLGGLTAAVRSRRDGPGSTALPVTLAGTSIYGLAYEFDPLTPDVRTSELLEIRSGSAGNDWWSGSSSSRWRSPDGGSSSPGETPSRSRWSPW